MYYIYIYIYIIPEKVHIKFCKYILGTNKFTSNDATRGELGRYPIAIQLNIGYH